jgi:hypothetical protein
MWRRLIEYEEHLDIAPRSEPSDCEELAYLRLHGKDVVYVVASAVGEPPAETEPAPINYEEIL